MRGQVECECPNCECVMDMMDVVERDGRYYCGEACANGHRDEPTCGHNGCQCGSEEEEEWEDRDTDIEL